MTRDLDLVLVGATGFVGRLTAAHLAARAPEGMRVALAGRSPARLAQVAAGLPGRAARWPLLTVDVSDAASVRALAGRTRVVVTTVGPYAVLGLPLVRACAAAGTHYADLTGEVLFVNATVTGCHQQAQRTGARIVHSCGFDSVPSDLGVLLTAQAARRDGAGNLTDTVLRVRRLNGGVSGGTVDSMRQQIVAARRDPRARRILADPHSLFGPDRPTRQRPRSGRGRPVARDERTGRWHAPFVMASFNAPLVRRSHALIGYGPDFRYSEVMDTGRGARGLVAATALAAGLAAFGCGMAWGPTRRVVDRFLPASGAGPSAERRAAGHFAMDVEAVTTSGARYRTTVAADLDPGYDGTAVMLGQAGLSLAEGEGSDLAGVLTPATALGTDLADRLRARGFVLDTQPLAPGSSG